MSPVLHPYWAPLSEAFEQAADPAVAAQAAAYMKHIAPFYGIKAPMRRELLQHFIKANGLPPKEMLETIILSAWHQPRREWHYAAMELLNKVKKAERPDQIDLYEKMLTTTSWWDTVDYIAPHLVYQHFIRFPEQRDATVQRWMQSGNLWLQRSCLIFQLKAKDKTDELLLFTLIGQLHAHKDFFIRKAIGWALREYAKSQPQRVWYFIEQQPISNLSKREALKHFEIKP